MNEAASGQEILIVTGMSGAGRSTVANTLEDLGWYVVDNLPSRWLKRSPTWQISRGSTASNRCCG
ncbi:RNase adapter RapZ [Leucobacter coleopterorum]|uniref:RNase adapter RapZ n=1 Tax=Leucobacter coleopterorum TaxID=2714933 RepID=UPI00313811A0